METFLIRALQLIMSLSLLVIIHEGGHFLFSRLFKVRVEKFYIFFDPWFLCSNSNRRTVIRNMVLAGCLWGICENFGYDRRVYGYRADETAC